MSDAFGKIVDKAWLEAIQFWGGTVQLHSPVDSVGVDKDSKKAIAYINLKTRQVVYNGNWFLNNNLEAALPAIFAHELGHHLKFPHSMKLSAELHLLGETLIPKFPFFYLNLFWDLLVNEYVGRKMDFREQLIKVYDASIPENQEDLSAVFSYYLGIYEYLWDIEGQWPLNISEQLKKNIPFFVQEFYQIDDFYDQFLFFLSYFVRYLPLEISLEFDPFGGDMGPPSWEDYPTGGGQTGSMKRALDRAVTRGWIKSSEMTQGKDSSNSDFRRMQDIIKRSFGSGDPNEATSAALSGAASKYYKVLVDQHIDLLPKGIGSHQPELELPSVIQSWEVGDDIQEIDWYESTSRSGARAGANLFRREKLSDEPNDSNGNERPDMEIYLDTSGSMPSPLRELNSMTLAAQILSSYTIRKGGRVRGAIYSHGDPQLSEWMYSEDVARSFFLHYIGGGTEFPFGLLEKWSNEAGKAYRIIISDRDFIRNLQDVGPVTFISAIEKSKALITVLERVEIGLLNELAGSNLSAVEKFQHIEVSDRNEFAKTCTRLARALLGE